VLDLERDAFLSTLQRQELLRGLPVASAPVIWSGRIRSAKQLRTLITASRFQTSRWRERLIEVCLSRGLDPDRVLRETDPASLMEGLYLKVEDERQVIARYKFVRSSFLQAVEDSDSHWLERPIVPNRLREGVDIFAKSV